MNAYEALLSQLLQKITQGTPQQVAPLGRMHVHVVIIGLEGMDGGAIDEAQSLACGNQQVIAGAGLPSGNANGGLAVLRRPEAASDALESAPEALFIIRLQQIVDGTQIECGERMGVVGGDEY